MSKADMIKQKIAYHQKILFETFSRSEIRLVTSGAVKINIAKSLIHSEAIT